MTSVYRRENTSDSTARCVWFNHKDSLYQQRQYVSLLPVYARSLDTGQQASFNVLIKRFSDNWTGIRFSGRPLRVPRIFTEERNALWYLTIESFYSKCDTSTCLKSWYKNRHVWRFFASIFTLTSTYNKYIVT